MAKKILFILVFSILALTKSYADHVSGGNLSVLHLGSSKYQVTLTFIMDCNGTAHVPSSKISYSCNTGSGSVILSFISKKEVTGFGANCNVKSRCSSTSLSGYGLEEYTYKDTVDLSSLNCCEVKMYWMESYRNFSINTLPINSFIYLNAIINKCAGASIVWENSEPQTYLQVGKSQILNTKATSNFINDSFSYKLVNPLGFNGKVINYTGSFSAQKPLRFLGFPVANQSPPSGFVLDAIRGNIKFRPQFVNETTIICVEATAWRRINGVMAKVAQSRKDLMVSTINQNNSTVPYQKTVEVFKGCEGDTSVVLLEIESTPSKKYEVKLIHNLTWAKAEFVSGTKFKYLKVRYLIDTLKPQHYTNAFTIDIKNDDCPIAGRTVKTYGIEKDSAILIDSSKIAITSLCNEVEFKVDNKNTHPDVKYKWIITKDSSIIYHDSNLFIQKYKDTGWVVALLIVSSPKHCNFYQYKDSFYIKTTDIIKLDAIADTNKVCFSTPVTTFINKVQGKTPLTFQWSTGQKGDTISLTPKKGDRYYTVKMIDDNGCTISDSVRIINYHPIVNISGDSLVCYGDSISLTANISDTASPTFGWNIAPNQFKIKRRALTSTQYTFTLNDNGCNYTKMIQTNISKPELVFNHNANVCEGQSMQLKVSPLNGLAPYQIFWDSYQKTGSTVSINTSGSSVGISSFSATVTDTLGCKGVGIGSFEILPSPKVNLTKPLPLCEDNTSYNLLTLAIPQGGVWTGNGIVSNVFNATLMGAGISELKYSFTNTSGCSDSSTTFIKVYAKPTINFTSDSTEIFKGSKVTFTNTTTTDTAYKSWWDFGDKGKTGNLLFKQDGNYTYSDTGKYTIKLRIDNGICSTDSILKTNYIIVKEHPQNPNISVRELSQNSLKPYPNPAKDKLTIEAGNPLVEIVLIDILGKRYRIENFSPSTKTEVNIAHLAAGIYIIEAKDVEGNIYTSKVMVSK